MTKEELKEAIAATITENGQKGITGQALANLLNEIVDAAGEGGGSGAGGDILIFNLRIDNETGAPITTPSDENLQFRQTLIEGINNNKSYSVLVNKYVDMSDVLEQLGTSGKYIMIESGVASYAYLNVPGTTSPGLSEDEILLLDFTNATDPTVTNEIIINSDGSITIEDPNTESTTE